MSAANGRLALEILQPESVDLVLTDLQMPVMDGAELCRQLHADERWQHLPVYVITADLSEQAAQRLAECGCQGPSGQTRFAQGSGRIASYRLWPP